MPLRLHQSMNAKIWSKNRFSSKGSSVKSNEDFLRRYLSIDYKTKARHEFMTKFANLDPTIHGFVLVPQLNPFDEMRYELLRLIFADMNELKYKHIAVIKDRKNDLKQTIFRQMFHFDNPINLFRTVSKREKAVTTVNR